MTPSSCFLKEPPGEERVITGTQLSRLASELNKRYPYKSISRSIRSYTSMGGSKIKRSFYMLAAFVLILILFVSDAAQFCSKIGRGCPIAKDKPVTSAARAIIAGNQDWLQKGWRVQFFACNTSALLVSPYGIPKRRRSRRFSHDP
jgi:hypothetical protein